jgi:hypothetical protein
MVKAPIYQGKRCDSYNIGGGEGTRTLDLRHAKPPLFQLSYTPVLRAEPEAATADTETGRQTS